MSTTSAVNHLNWLNLVAIPGVGPSIFKEIRNRAKTSDVINYSDQELKHLGFNRRLRSLLLDKSCRELALQRADKAIRWAEVPGHHLIFIDDPEYPELLKNIADPPAFLFVDGDINVLCMNQIAMVGTRKPSPSGYDAAKIFAHELVKNDYVITSGLAYGVDAASHQGALKGAGQTIAVLGCGIDVIYPKKHAELAAQIRQNGAVVSEFFPGVEPQKTFFPRRNRLISGLSMGVVVVEAAKKSGSLITAKFALEQGREIFALPGSIFNTQSQGCHELIKQGANLAESVDDILHGLNGWLKSQPSELSTKTQDIQAQQNSIEPRSHEKGASKGRDVTTHSFETSLQYTGHPKQMSFSDCIMSGQDVTVELFSMDRTEPSDNHQTESQDIEQRVLLSLDNHPAPIDTLVQRSGLQSRQVLVALLNLEIKGLITHHAGGYCLANASAPTI